MRTREKERGERANERQKKDESKITPAARKSRERERASGLYTSQKKKLIGNKNTKRGLKKKIEKETGND